MNKMIKLLGALIWTLWVTTSFAAAQNVITAIEVSDLSTQKQQIKITFSGDAPTPTSFSVNTPPRIALDFPNTVNQTGKAAEQVNSFVLRSMNIAEGSGRTRLMLSLQKQASFETKVVGKTIMVTLDGTASAPSSTETTHFAAESKQVASTETIKSIDFRRGSLGEAKIIVDLSNPNVGIDIRQAGKNLVVDFAKATLPKNLERRLDVSDFGTPVAKVDAYAQGDSTKLSIEPTGNWEYSAYQAENRFIVEVRQRVEERIQAAKPTYKGEKLSLNFQNVEIRTVLQVIAEFTGLNVITSETVSGSLTLRLKDVPWDQALDIILQAKGLDQRKVGNVLWIAPRDELAAKEKQELEVRKQITELEPTRTQFFHLKYHKAEAFEKILKDEKQKILSSRGSVVIDPRTNTLMVQDIPSKLEELRTLVDKIDIPVRQVMIEARIVEAEDTFSRVLGSKLGVSRTGTTNDYGGSTSLASGGLSGYAAGALTASFGSVLGSVIDLELSALEAEGKAKIVSSPRLVTADQMEAVIEDGQEIPYTTISDGGTNVQFKKATLSLKVTPQITPDGNVMMDLKVNKDSPGETVSGGLAINTKQITTKVLVENGGTVVIGGIYVQTQNNAVTKIPLLGDIPFIGHLFRQTTKEDEKRELLIFVTPRILRPEMSVR